MHLAATLSKRNKAPQKPDNGTVHGMVPFPWRLKTRTTHCRQEVEAFITVPLERRRQEGDRSGLGGGGMSLSLQPSGCHPGVVTSWTLTELHTHKKNHSYRYHMHMPLTLERHGFALCKSTCTRTFCSEDGRPAYPGASASGGFRIRAFASGASAECRLKTVFSYFQPQIPTAEQKCCFPSLVGGVCKCKGQSVVRLWWVKSYTRLFDRAGVDTPNQALFPCPLYLWVLEQRQVAALH